MTKSKTPFLDAVRQNESKHEDAIDELRELMRKRGWEYTCDTPGSMWMWTKKLPDGRILLVDLDTAVRFEEDLCGEEYENDD